MVLKIKEKGNLTNKLAKSVKIATEEYWSDLALNFGSFSTGSHFLNNKKRRKKIQIYYQKHQYENSNCILMHKK